MALFKVREEYLETRILDFDPSIDESITSSNRRKRGGQKDKENHAILANSFKVAFEDKVALRLLTRMYRHIDDKQRYALRKSDLKRIVSEHVRKLC